MDDAALGRLWRALHDERHHHRLIGRFRPRMVGWPHPRRWLLRLPAVLTTTSFRICKSATMGAVARHARHCRPSRPTLLPMVCAWLSWLSPSR